MARGPRFREPWLNLAVSLVLLGALSPGLGAPLPVQRICLLDLQVRASQLAAEVHAGEDAAPQYLALAASGVVTAALPAGALAGHPRARRARAPGAGAPPGPQGGTCTAQRAGLTRAMPTPAIRDRAAAAGGACPDAGAGLVSALAAGARLVAPAGGCGLVLEPAGGGGRGVGEAGGAAAAFGRLQVGVTGRHWRGD
jgi:hypothetical protein